MKKINASDILAATEYGKTVILHYYPQSSVGFSSKRNFRLRSDDKNPSATVFFKENKWYLQDKGGSDNKAYNAISLVMERESLNFPQALEWIAAKFAPHMLSEAVPSMKPSPDITPATPSDHINVHTRDGAFTEKELAQLGYKITDDTCKYFNLRPVDYYITKKNAKGKSYKISSTEAYPIYYYDYGNWGKLYQPLGDIRFMYVGEKPDDYVFGDNTFLKIFDKVMEGTISTGTRYEDEESQIENDEDERLKKLIICSGPSDALNTFAAGYNVCWFNSESEDVKPITMSRLFRCCHELYIMYDIDDTGLANMYKLGLQYLDLNIIRLPEDLRDYKTKGKPCKDIKDYMMYYRKRGRNNPHKNFEGIVTTSLPLKWWILHDGGKDGVSYDIDNAPLYNFLAANGFYRMETPSDKKGYQFIHIDGNRVTIIPDERFPSEVKKFLTRYLQENPNYYNRILERTITRTRQLTLSSLDNLPIRKLDFQSWSKDEEWVFFSNTAVRITAKGIDTLPSSKCPFYVVDLKTIKHDFHVEKPFFNIQRSEEAQSLLMEIERARNTSGPRSPEFIGLNKRYDRLTSTRRWKLELLRDDCTFMKYVYNTGRSHWRKEELGYALEEEEQAETELNFINKVMALGYLLCKYKDASKPYAVYCMEMTEGENGEHNGGTGKSLFARSISEIRNQTFVSGQEYDPSNPRFLLQEVKKDITDNLFMDDLNTKVDLHRFMPMITGNMTVNPKYIAAFTIDFKESPKVVFTSNHAIKNFDPSLRRRTFFAAFSDYYHAENPIQKLPERTPATEFGKQLINDYTTDEMNAFYNFMLQCLQIYMVYREKVNPPMENIERRTLRNSIGEDFLWWASDYFNEERVNREVDKHEAFENYKTSISDTAAKNVKMRNFTDRIKMFCSYKDWEFNPERVLTTPTERERGEIRRFEDGKDKYYFYISTVKEEDEVDIDGDDPPFEP